MLKKIVLSISLLFASLYIHAQADSSHLRISLVTCGPGDEEIYEVFGHTAVRVVDSEMHTDDVYNYGTFEYGPNFEIQFMRGKLLYSLSVYPFNAFVQEYVEAHRSVEEQVLTLTGKQKEDMYAFLRWNAEPAHRYYKYDFFFDNCATRIRDLFTNKDIINSNFQFGNALPGGRLTFRDIMNQYFYRDHWTRVGVNILMGKKTDKVMSNEDIMFLPDYLRDGVGGATVNGKKIAAPSVTILQGSKMGPAGIDGPFIVTLAVLLLTVLGLSMPSLRWLGRIMSSLVMFVTGLLGLVILVMWFGTDHQTCRDNFNLLWALPTNLILVFARPKGSPRYALIAITLIFLTLILHLIKVQALPLLELSPLLLSQLFIFGTIYKRSRQKPL